MNKLEIFIQFLISNLFETIVLICIVTTSTLRGYQLILEGTLINIVLFSLSALIVKWVFYSYLNFMLEVRKNNFFNDNRAVQFLNFDAMKFMLIAISLVGVIYLGINKVLNNETIATLLGGLIGSLLTMKGSYNDLKFTKEERDSIQSAASPNQQVVNNTENPIPKGNT